MNTNAYRIIFAICFSVSLMFYGLAGYLIPAENNNGSRIKVLMNSKYFVGSIQKTMICDITAYCPGPCCNSQFTTRNGKIIYNDWSDQLAVGSLSIRFLHDNGIEIAAVDPKEIPFGSIILWDNKYYLALDSGGAIKGNRIDISAHSHEEAEKFGRKHEESITIFIPQNPEDVVSRIKDIYCLEGES